MTLLDSLLFVSALVGGLCFTFFLLGLITDHLWPRLAMRQGRHPFATLKPCASTGKQHPQWRPPHWQPDRR